MARGNVVDEDGAGVEETGENSDLESSGDVAGGAGDAGVATVSYILGWPALYAVHATVVDLAILVHASHLQTIHLHNLCQSERALNIPTTLSLPIRSVARPN
jgi:hypothetical protein